MSTGLMRDNAAAIDALLADRSRAVFGEIAGEGKQTYDGGRNDSETVAALFRDLLALGGREADEIRARFPDVLRRVGSYNLDALLPGNGPNNLAHLLVGSEGTPRSVNA